MDDGLTRFVPHVYRLSLRLTSDPHRAEDLTQETFLRAWRNRMSLQNEAATRVWLFRIAANLWKDERRQNNVSGTHTRLIEENVRAAIQRPEHKLETEEHLEEALRLMNQLPPRQQAVLYLTAVEELSLIEICDVLEIDKNAAKASLSLARKRMREELAKRMRGAS